VLKAIAEGKGPSRYLVALGYAGWGEGQLDEEMGRPGWFTTDGNQHILFGTPAEDRWEAGFKAEGIDPRMLDSGAGAA
jgi:putative transcriptional regulator